MPGPRPIPAILLTRAFTRAEAEAAGVTASQLRARRFSSPLHGVHAVTEVTELLGRCAAARLVLPAGFVFSDITAGCILELPVPIDDRLHVTRVGSGSAAIRRRGVKGHVRELADDDVWNLGDLAFTAPGRTFLDLAESLKRAALVAFADAMLRARLVDPVWMRARIDQRSGRRGNDMARRALDSADPRSESPMESALRVLLLDAGLPAPEVNPELRDAAGRFLARADLFYRQARLLVEYDGDHHRTDRLQFANDVRRSSNLTAAGYAQLRFTATDVLGRPEHVVSTVATTLRRRGVRW